ncbi:MAG: transporter substrate-binding domain-containing protein [Sphaerochaeta sp.]|jgi:putative glutamine transport system substrate-binding protein|nr:transporter substrate-binding domain-containing protein [Sphaerochaeta sp.]
MKKTLVLSVVLLLAATVAFAQGTTEKTYVDQIRDRGVLQVGCKVDVPNFGYKNITTGEIEGFEIDLSKAVAKKIFGDENKVAFTGVTAKTRGPLLDTGELDMVAATFTVTDERRKTWDFSTIYYTDAVGVMVKKASGITKFADLNGKTVGVAQSSTTRKSLQAEADKAGITVNFLEFATYPELKVALDSGRIDAFSVDGSILNGYLEDSCIILPERFSPQDYGVAVKKGNTALLNVINETIDELQKSGELDAMLKKWSLK